MPHLQTTVVHAPDQVVVRLSGDVDVVAADRLTRTLLEAAVGGRGAVVVDVAGACFRDCSGLQVLAEFSDTLVPAGRRCRIVGAPAATRRLVRSTGLGERLELDGPVDTADPRPTVPLPPPRGPSPARRAALPYQVRPGRRAEERPGRRRLRPGSLRRWR
ncbi:STAS domain-containing protein [Geodermatophilus poikilotrophus]|uniref:Anti-anti-sigma factor n=1 Tax=Geodermatophilus poikilotrophus TaxID=1333667 RepID=A0A1I0DTR2_9ACTN|nr:STAS domain-containing protein [Geodermatophilus poikilotrophus]SET36005.1 anti-anti-sigma factor [Geodermatophilus poikilotrophus]